MVAPKTRWILTCFGLLMLQVFAVVIFNQCDSWLLFLINYDSYIMKKTSDSLVTRDSFLGPTFC